MKSICFALVAVSLISPASAGRVREALMELEAPCDPKVSPKELERVTQGKLSNIHVAMSSRKLRYMMYDMQLTSAIARCAGLWTQDKPRYEKILETLVILRSTITRKLKEMEKLHDQTIAAFQHGQGLATYDQLKSSKPRLSRVQAEDFEKQWKKYADALHQNKAFLVSLSLGLGEEFSQIESTDEVLKEHLANVTDADGIDDSLKDGRENLLEHLQTFGKPLNVFDFVKARIKHFSVAGYEGEVNEGALPPVVQAPEVVQPQGQDAQPEARRPARRQQQQPPVQSHDDDEVIPPAQPGSNVVPQEEQRSDAVIHQEYDQPSHSDGSPRSLPPASSAPASPHDSPPPSQRVERQTSTASSTSSASSASTASQPGSAPRGRGRGRRG